MKKKSSSSVSEPKFKKSRMADQNDENVAHLGKKVEKASSVKKEKTIPAASTQPNGYTIGGLSEFFNKPATVDESIVVPVGETSIVRTSPKKAKKENRDVQRENRRKVKKMTPEEKERTIFVGNMPLDATEKLVGKIFSEYGKIESVRMRGLIPEKQTITKRITHATKEYNEKQKSLIFYVKFMEKESVEKALEKNGDTIEGHRIRVDVTTAKRDYDKNYTIFVGNLPFNVTENQISAFFEKEIGPVIFSRLVKDNVTGNSKGIAFVNFKDTSSTDIALHMSSIVFEGRELRISKTLKKKQIAKRVEEAKKQKKKVMKDGASGQPSKADKFKFSTRKNTVSSKPGEKVKIKKTAKKAILKKKNIGGKKSLMQ